MTYSVSRNGSILGEFSDTELQQALREGRLAVSDHAWKEGMSDWSPLSDVLGIAVPPPLPPSPPPNPFSPPRSETVQAMPALGDQMGMRLLLPVGRSGWAIAAGYLGLFSLLAVPGPVAVIVSIIALVNIQKSKQEGRKRLHGTGRAIFGLLMGILGTAGLVNLAVFLCSRHA
jgi:hypothetical protein